LALAVLEFSIFFFFFFFFNQQNQWPAFSPAPVTEEEPKLNLAGLAGLVRARFDCHGETFTLSSSEYCTYGLGEMHMVFET
jgi:hypothetical protein